MKCNPRTVMSPSKFRISTRVGVGVVEGLTRERDIGNNTQRTWGLDAIHQILIPSYFCTVTFLDVMHCDRDSVAAADITIMSRAVLPVLG